MILHEALTKKALGDLGIPELHDTFPILPIDLLQTPLSFDR